MITEAKCKGQKFGHNFPFTGSDCLNCGVNQRELSYGRPKEEKNFFDGYLERLKNRPPVETKARNYMEETTLPYLKYINWQNETFDKDTRAFWISANKYYRSHTHAEYTRLLEWIARKNCLFPKQVVKLFLSR
jgi:hypothetical protein